MTTPPPGAAFRSCRSCPSFLEADKVVGAFRKSIGSPMCGRYGHVLGKPGGSAKQTDKLATYFGQKCDAFGQPRPPSPVSASFMVAMPVMDNREANLNPVTRDACRSCSSCTKFVPELIMERDFGWTAGLCSAKGKLIRGNQQVFEARDCPMRELGRVMDSTLQITLLPEYEDAFQLNADPVKSYFKNKGTLIEPHDYETDKPVSQEDIDSGIRAWRKVPDPAGSGNEAFLPVYDLEFFDEVERAKIPRSGDDEHPELYVDHFGGVYLAAVAWTELDETPAAWGEAGVGKTELFRHLAWLMCLPFERISITGQTELDDLAGKMLFNQELGTHFQYGRLSLAWGKPCVLCLDEPNVGPPEVWQFVRPLTDNSKQMVLDMNAGERIPRNTDCYLGFAMNPAWDVRNVGAMPIGDADANRLFHVFIELPPESLEKEIIVNRVKLDGWDFDTARLETLMGIAKDIRALSADDTLPITWGIRPQIKVARAMRWFDPITAYRRAVADYLEPQAQKALLDVVRAHV